MTILIVLLGMLLSHLVYPIARWRSFDWFTGLMGPIRSRPGGREWEPALAVIVLSLGLSLGAGALAVALLGSPGWFLLALCVFVYTLGPRDLDRDVQSLLAARSDPRHLKARRLMRIQPEAGPREAAAGVFHAAQARWFGTLLWFVVLGIAGALLYRLTRLSLNLPGLSPGQASWLLRLRAILDWPVLALMLISAGLGGDLDRVRQAWRMHVSGRSAWSLQDGVLDEVAAVMIDPAASFEDGVTAGHHLVWRMLLIWLVVLSLLLIAGWLS
ncbi:hypothetical protein [Wenzhouxiangella limi]|uniref:Regulatory signaling modulator protein AmpE n=1 Tax=Wenzhouxiangella limi TaxID=2707351 RepID=A0A845UX76_9GAMM|nr:hypothetical protein [Wenzhouxiangella limi]NDY96463.1 hypothetical protein [Wenzhouxiangella limi]